MRLRACFFPGLPAVLLLCLVSSVGAEMVTVFGPATYTRDTGKPSSNTSTFSVPGDVSACKLLVTDGSGAGNEVKNLIVSINGEQLFAPRDLYRSGSAEKNISLKTSNTISVTLLGQPGDSVVLEIIGEKEQAPPPPMGGAF